MNSDNAYHKQVSLLMRIIPLIAYVTFLPSTLRP